MTIIDIIKVEVFEFYFIACSVYIPLCSLFPRIGFKSSHRQMLITRRGSREEGDAGGIWSSSSIHRFFNIFVSERVSAGSFNAPGKISCHYYLSSQLASAACTPLNPCPTSRRAIFSIKFIHLLIIAVNHSSCNDFYEFLFMHRAQSFGKSLFCRCRPYSSLLSIIISLTDTVVRKIGWLQAFLRLKK